MIDESEKVYHYIRSARNILELKILKRLNDWWAKGLIETFDRSMFMLKQFQFLKFNYNFLFHFINSTGEMEKDERIVINI